MGRENRGALPKQPRAKEGDRLRNAGSADGAADLQGQPCTNTRAAALPGPPVGTCLCSEDRCH